VPFRAQSLGHLRAGPPDKLERPLPDERLGQTKARIENSMHRTFARTVIDPRSEKLLPINFDLRTERAILTQQPDF
jgi:hypothetical protein